MTTRGITTGKVQAIVTMRDVVKRYGNFQALQGISLTVGEGEIVVVIGPSGSGKSTLIRTINALEPYDAGTVAVDGISLDGSRRSVDKVRRKVGMVFQQFNLFPHLTVLQEYHPRAAGRSRATQRGDARDSDRPAQARRP